MMIPIYLVWSLSSGSSFNSVSPFPLPLFVFLAVSPTKICLAGSFGRGRDGRQGRGISGVSLWKVWPESEQVNSLLLLGYFLCVFFQAKEKEDSCPQHCFEVREVCRLQRLSL